MARNPVPRSRLPLVLVIFMIAVVLYVAREVLIPITLAIFISFLLAPLVRACERLRIHRVIAVCLVVTIATVSVVAVGWLVEQQAVELAGKLPAYKANILDKLSVLRPGMHSVLDNAGTTIKELGQEIAKPVGEPAAAHDPLASGGPAAPVGVRVVEEPTPPLTYAKTYLGPLLARLATAGMVVVFTNFLLLRREDIRSRVIRLIGASEMHHTTPAFDDAAQRLGKYLLMQSLVNGCIGLCIGVGLFFLDVPGAPLWGLVIALLRFVPYVGVWIGAAFPIVLSLASSTGWSHPLLVMGLIGVVELVGGNFIEPFVVGAGTGLSPLAVLISAVLWAWLWGPVGLILATPITVCLAVLGRHVRSLSFLEVLLGDEPVLTPQANCYQRLLAGDQEEATKIVEDFAKGKTIVEVFDGLLLPALAMAEADRHRGELDERQEQTVRDILSAIVEDVGSRESALGPTNERNGSARGPVLCVPARDAADELSARMLERVLHERGIAAETVSSQLSPREMVQHISDRPAAALCICALPPGALLHTRVLWQQLRTFGARVVIGLWDEGANLSDLQARLGLSPSGSLATSLKQAADQLEAIGTVPDPMKEAETTPVA